MSKIAVSSPAAGTATYTISAPAGSTDRTITLPDASGTILTTATPGVPVDGPAFRAYRATSNQAVTAGVNTKVALNAEDFDTNNCFDPVTNYRFTPTVAGYYSVYGQIYHGATTTRATAVSLAINKNGSVAAYTEVNLVTANQLTITINASLLVYMNGTTDYLELYGSQTGGAGNVFISGSGNTFLQAFLARSAT